MIARDPDATFDERLADIPGVAEHDDVAAARLAVRQQMAADGAAGGAYASLSTSK